MYPCSEETTTLDHQSQTQGLQSRPPQLAPYVKKM
jgi:hypothetical protein